jgi:hypothetical protein
MKRTINVMVSPNGDISIDAIGFQGLDCENATKALEDALGVVQDREKKPEYHVRARAKAKQTIGR